MERNYTISTGAAQWYLAQFRHTIKILNFQFMHSCVNNSNYTVNLYFVIIINVYVSLPQSWRLLVVDPCGRTHGGGSSWSRDLLSLHWVAPARAWKTGGEQHPGQIWNDYYELKFRARLSEQSKKSADFHSQMAKMFLFGGSSLIHFYNTFTVYCLIQSTMHVTTQVISKICMNLLFLSP